MYGFYGFLWVFAQFCMGFMGFYGFLLSFLKLSWGYRYGKAYSLSFAQVTLEVTVAVVTAAGVWAGMSHAARR